MLTSKRVFTTVMGISRTPLIVRATTPKAIASRGPGLSQEILDLSQWSDEKYRPTPGTQRVIDCNRKDTTIKQVFSTPREQQYVNKNSLPLKHWTQLLNNVARLFSSQEKRKQKAYLMLQKTLVRLDPT